MASTTGTFGWLRGAARLRTMPDMALASIQGSVDTAANPVDAYLLEIYRQVAETTRPTATPRYARLATFLAFVGVMTAALAVLVAVPEDAGGPVITGARIGLGVIGLLVSLAFYATDMRPRGAIHIRATADAATDTTSSIYLASAGFFVFAIAMASALLLVR
jgi:hypothetical protein